MGDNEYDEALEQQAPASEPAAAPVNPYDAILKQQNAGREQGLRTAVVQADATTPDRAAEVQRLQERTGIPADIINRDYDRIRARARLTETPYTAMLKETPHLAAWAAEQPVHAALAKDDMEQLGALEWLVTAPPRAFAQGVNQWRYGSLRAESLFRPLSREEQDQLASYKLHMDEGGQLGAGTSWFKGAITGAAQQLPNLFGAGLYGLKYGAAGALEAGVAGAIAGSVIPGVGTVAGAIAGATAGFKAGGLYGGWKATAQLEAGLAYDEYAGFKDEYGQTLDPQVARLAALATGAINGGLELFEIETLLKSFPGVKQLGSAGVKAGIAQALRVPTVRAALSEAAKVYAGTLATETATEVAQRAVTILSGELGKFAGGAGKAPGQLERGNVNLFQQPRVTNADGTISTVDSLSVEMDGKEVLLPTVTPDGRHLKSPEEAIAEYRQHGKHLGVFDSPASATAYASQLHEDYAAGKYDQKSKYRTAGSIVEDLISEATGAVQGFALTVLPGPILEIAAGAQRARRAQQTPQFFKALAEGVAQSKTVERAPAAVQALLERATKDGPIATVYAPIDTWNTYWQAKGLDPAAVAADVTGSHDAYEQAANHGGDLAIPTARYAVKLAATEHNGYFANELRLGPDEMNGREAAEFDRKLRTEPLPTAAPPSPIRASLVAELERAGVPATTREHYANLYESAVTSLAERAGVDPVQLYESYGLKVQRPDLAETAPPAGQAARQEATAGAVPVTGDGLPLLPLEAAGGPDEGPVRASGAADQPIAAMADLGAAAAQMRSEGIKPTAQGARAVFLAHGPDGPLYNIVGGPKDRSTVTAAGLAAEGIPVPETPADTGDRLTGDQIRARMLTARAEAVDNQPATAETGAADGETADRAGESAAASEGPNRYRGPRDRGLAESRPRERETPKQRASRRDKHYAAVLDDLLDAARALDPAVDEQQVRDEFAFRLEAFETLQQAERESGHDANDLLRAIAGYGGITTDEQTFPGEVRYLRDGGKFGQVNGIRVFQKGGIALDRMITSLQQDQRFQWVTDANTLIDAIDDAIRNPPGVDTLPGTDELALALGMEPERAWWSPSWQPKAEEAPLEEATTDAVDQGGDASFNIDEFSQSLFDALNPPPEEEKVDTLDTGEQQARLPGDAGAVREQNVPTPEFDAPFSLTSETAKPGKGKQTTLFQSVYHGSPHKFDAFNLQAIGTGEGAQAYGWGLYFASNREIAEYYRDVLTQGREEKFAALSLVESGDIDERVRRQLAHAPDDQARAAVIDREVRLLEDNITKGNDGRRGWGADTTAIARRMQASLLKLKESGNYAVEPNQGRVYTVTIPDDEDMLAWDKPASQQSEKVQTALRAIGVQWDPLKVPSLKQALRMFEGSRVAALAREDVGIRASLREGLHYVQTGNEEAFAHWYGLHQGIFATKGNVDPTGDSIYQNLQRDATVEHRHLSLKEAAMFASLKLNQQGVAGIKYLDGNSRRSGEGSSNYVVFDARLAKITSFDQPFFHGSPHDFHKFSLQHVGTGEGAAAYGWGLYFAENPAVAADYHDRLSEGRDVVKMKLGTLTFGERDGFNYSRLAHVNSLENVRASLAEEILTDPLELNAAGEAGFQQLVLNRLDERIADNEKNYPEVAAAAKTLRAQLAKPGAVSVEFTKTTGGVYQVDIPDEHIANMIDWDAPIKDQPAKVQQIVRDRLKELRYLRPKDNGPRQLTAAFKAFTMEHGGFTDGPTGAMAYAIVRSAEEEKLVAPVKAKLAALEAAHPPAEGQTGRIGGDQAVFNAWTALHKELEDAREQSAKNASLALAAQGVPGIKYFDQGSRDAGKGTRNIVVFDDSIVTLTHKDGSPLTDQERKDFFQSGPTDDPNLARRGFIRFGPDRQMNIHLLERADLSTFLHESGHFFLEVMGDLADQVAAADPATLTAQQRGLLSDYGSLLETLGVQNRRELQTEHHEQFARLFEAYLMEGKAPSVGLQQTFSRFRAWLVGIYRSLQNLQVTLSDPVRQVLDRLVASDVAIADAEARRGVPPMFTTAALAGMSEQQFSLYKSTIAEASRVAREQLDRKILGEVQREQTAAWKAQRADLEAAVTQEFNEHPAYRALAAMQRGENPDGTPMVEGLETAPLKLSKQMLVDRYGEERLKRLPRPFVYTVDGGMDPETVARIFGFSSGDAMLTALEGLPRLKQAIAKETDKRMLATHGSLLLDGTLQDAVQGAIANEERDLVLRAELRALGQLRRTVEPFVKQERKAGQAALAGERKERDYERRWLEAEGKLKVAIAEGRKQVEIDELHDEIQNLKQKARGGAATIRAGIPPAAQMRDIAKARIAALPIRKIDAAAFWSASRRAGQQALERAARQDFEGAIVAKQQELINLNLYREAEATVEDIADRTRFAKDLAGTTQRKKLGLAGASYLEQVDGLLDRFEFAKVPQATLDRRASLRKWVESLEAQGLPVDLPEEVLDDSRRRNYQELTVEEFVGVTDALKQIVHLAALKNRLLKNQDQREFIAVRDQVVESIRAHTATQKAPLEFRPADQKWRTVADWFASHTKLSQIAQAFDGYVDGGAVWSAIMQPLNAAGDAEETRKGKAGDAYSKILEEHYPGRQLATLNEKLEIPEIGGSLSKEGRLAVALNWGNQTSRDRLLNDPVRQWNLAQVQAVLDTLDGRDWKFVQASWDYLNTFWPEIAAKQERITGLAPEKVEAIPVETKFGTFAGGYYPLAYDSRLNARAAQNEAASQAKLTTAAAYVRNTTKRGHVEARKSNVRLSVRLELSVAFQHLEQVIHDLTHHEALIDVTRLLRDGTVSKAILETKGDVTYQQMTRAIQDIAIGSTPAAGNVLDKAANYMRTGTQLASLGFNLWTGAQQPLGLFNGMARVGPRWVMKGLVRWLRDAASMENTTKWIAEVSPMMRERTTTGTQDLHDLRAQLRQPGGWFDGLVRTVSGDHVTQQTITDSFLWHIGLMQRVADVPVWLGQYEKSMAAGENEARAVAIADQAVLDSQGGGNVKDLAQIQRGGPVARLFMTFYSYGNTVFNATARAAGQTNFRSPASVGQFLGHLSLLYAMPALATVTLSRLFGRTGGDGDTPGSFLEDVGREALATALNTMVLVRELGQLVQQGTRGYAGPAGARALEVFYKLGEQVKQGEVDEGLVKALNTVAGVLFRYPALQVQRTVDGWVALEEGRTKNPAALLFGAPPKASTQK